MNKLFEEEIIVDENERLLDTLKFLTEIEREDGEKEDTWAWLESAMDFEGRTEEELIKFCQDNGFKVFRVTGDGETAGGLVAAGSSITPEQIQAEYADFYEVTPEVTEIEAKKKNESLKENFKSRKLHEGTANFRSQDAFDMYAIDDKELVGFEDWTDEEKEDYENSDYDYFEACAYDYIEDLDRLTDELTEQLEYFTITSKGGYYSGIQSYVFPNCNRNTGRDYEHDNIEDAIYDLAYNFEYYDGMPEEEADKKARELINAEVEKINKELLPRLKEVGMYRIAVSARFSNGETWYSKVDEKLHEGWRGCKDIEMIWHGASNDPELQYGDEIFNYWDVEDALWQDFIDEHPEFYGAEGEKEIEAEDEFNQYCREHAAALLDDWIAAKNESLKEDVESLADQVGNRCLDLWEEQRDIGDDNPQAMAEYGIDDPEDYAEYVMKKIFTVDDIYDAIKDKVTGEEKEIKKLIKAWVDDSLEYEVESLKEGIMKDGVIDRDYAMSYITTAKEHGKSLEEIGKSLKGLGLADEEIEKLLHEEKKDKELLITPDYKGITSDGKTTDLGTGE